MYKIILSSDLHKLSWETLVLSIFDGHIWWHYGLGLRIVMITKTDSLNFC